jgi:hypothetical protein
MDDLLGVFQRVQSANLRGKLPFVLFDEVDGRVGGHHVLANFLAPMWDGVFHAGKESFALGRGVFCFAASNMVPPPTVEIVLGENAQGSKEIVDYSLFDKNWQEKIAERIGEKEPKVSEIEKCKDFIDRIDVKLCIPPIHWRLLGEVTAASESTDLECILIQKHFPQVARIEMSAIAVLIMKLAKTTSRRGAEKVVFSSRTPDGDTFGYSNLPSSEKNGCKNDVSINKFHNLFLRIIVKKPVGEIMLDHYRNLQ